jgi:uncharacterized protein YraI
MSVFAAVFAVLTVAATGAFAAQAATSLNVRAWPNGRVVDVLHPGEHVQIVGRSGGWCQIEHRGPDGWASCRYLTNSYTQPGFGGGNDYGNGSNNSGSVTFSFGTPGFGFSIGSDHDTRRVYRPWDYRRDNDCIQRYGQWYCPMR